MNLLDPTSTGNSDNWPADNDEKYSNKVQLRF